MQDVYENTVRFEETDAQGIVFYGNYVTYQDETTNAFLEATGFDYETLVTNAWDVHVVNVELNYHNPARFQDDLVNAMRATAINETSIELAYECRRKNDGTVLVDGSVTHVVVAGGEPTHVPDELREAIVVFQETPPDPV